MTISKNMLVMAAPMYPAWFSSSLTCSSGKGIDNIIIIILYLAPSLRALINAQGHKGNVVQLALLLPNSPPVGSADPADLWYHVRVRNGRSVEKKK